MPGGSKKGGGLEVGSAYKMKGSPHKTGTIEGTSAYKAKTQKKTYSTKKDDPNYVTYGQDLYNSDGTKSNVSREHTTGIQSDADGNRYVHDEQDVGGKRYYLKKPDNPNTIT